MPHLYTNVEGWFDYSPFYDEMVDKFDNAHFVEVGCWFGRSGSYLLEKIKEDGKNIIVDFVDHWLGDVQVPYQQEMLEKNGEDFIFNSFKNNISLADPNYAGKVHRVDSVVGADLYEDGSLDFVFLDANHSYEQTKVDIELWLPKVKVGGVLAGHDYEFEPTKRAVHELLGELEEKRTHVWYYYKAE